MVFGGEWRVLRHTRVVGLPKFDASPPDLHDRIFGDYRRLYKDYLARSWLPVAADGCGDYYLVDLTGTDDGHHAVFFWDHETDWDAETGNPSKGYAVASNVWVFSLLFLRHELARHDGSHARGEYWHCPFDPDRTLRHDPNLADVTSAPLPWKPGNT